MVVKTENHQSGRGNNPSGNYVRILHDDGTMGVYLHLMRGSVAVREGQRVEAGMQIGRSGNTGNSTGPHLHFVVQRNVGLALGPFRSTSPSRSTACPTSPWAAVNPAGRRPGVWPRRSGLMVTGPFSPVTARGRTI